jgi:hypothetical protein
MTNKIFINYRRADSGYAVAWLKERLVHAFGEDSVFVDLKIPAGDDFREYISKKIDECSIVLSVIGNQWVSIKDESGNLRLNDSHDLVVIELQEALKAKKRIIPIILDGATVPPADGNAGVGFRITD